MIKRNELNQVSNFIIYALNENTNNAKSNRSNYHLKNNLKNLC